MKCTNMFDIDAFSSLPISLKDSDYVDLLLLLSGLKKAVRIGNNSVKRDNKMLNTVLMFKAITNNTMIMTIKIIFCLKFLSIQYNYMTDR